MTDTKPYLLSNVAAQAEDRFAALSALFDHTTFRHLDAVGIAPGWRCWEVGAGGLSVPGWMAGRVGSQGRVVATDIDTSWLAGDTPGIEVYVHDVGADEDENRKRHAGRKWKVSDCTATGRLCSGCARPPTQTCPCQAATVHDCLKSDRPRGYGHRHRHSLTRLSSWRPTRWDSFAARRKLRSLIDKRFQLGLNIAR